MTTMAPESAADLFSDDVLTDPYPTLADLRAAGPVVWLSTLDVFVLPRYAEARAALGDHATFSSAQGVALNEAANAIRRSGSASSSLIVSDPPRHTQLRSVLAERLAPKALRKLRADIEGRADELVEEVVGRGSFDAVRDLAEPFPVNVVADLIGLPREGRDKYLLWADGAFNAAGPDNERTQRGVPLLKEQLEYLTSVATRDRLTPGSMGAAIFEAADRGDIESDTILPLLSAYLTAGMDTTMNAIGHAVWLFGRHPDQWEKVHENPDLIPGAFNEILRIETPAQTFSRVATTDHDAWGVTIPKGARVSIHNGSANRDERKWADPERFDVTRDAADHLAFGYGIHGCAGQGLARLEGHAIIAALVRRVARFEVGEVERRINNVARGLASCPVAVTRA